MAASPMFLLHGRLAAMIVYSPNSGDPNVDAQIASILGVPALPYTSNDANAQTLLPAGWSWSLDAQENILAVRASDNQTEWGLAIGSDGNRSNYSEPLERCLAAIAAQLTQSNDVS